MLLKIKISIVFSYLLLIFATLRGVSFFISGAADDRSVSPIYEVDDDFTDGETTSSRVAVGMPRMSQDERRQHNWTSAPKRIYKSIVVSITVDLKILNSV